MPFLAVTAAIFASLAQAADEPPITVLGYPWAPFISPMGEPFRGTSAGDDPFARWFHQADRNRDGMLTADEMQADAERFFAMLDGNRDAQIDPEEMTAYEMEIAPEVQINTRWKRSAQALAEDKAKLRDAKGRRRADRDIDGYQPNGLQGAARYGLLNIPQPVAGADADFNRATTLDEFRRAAFQRFHLLDSKRLGHLTFVELQPLLPARPNKEARAKRSKDEPTDTRIGQPFPAED